MQEKSFGVIPLKVDQDLFKILMVQHQEGHWTFCKGHPNANESAKQTAERELFEELHLEVLRYLPLKQIDETYTFKRGNSQIEKTNSYFFVEVIGEMKLQKEEINDARWVNLKQARALCNFEEGKELVHQISLLVELLKDF